MLFQYFFTSVTGGNGGGGSHVNKAINKVGEVLVGGQKIWINAAVASSHGRVALAFTALAGLALAAAFLYTSRGRLKSPWFRRKRKHILSAEQWRILFTPEGRFPDGGIKFLKKVRSGGVDPNIRAEVWPFLLGVYDLNSSKEERDDIRTENRKEYEKLRQQCRRLLKENSESLKLNGCDRNIDASLTGGTDSPDSEDIISARESLSSEEKSQHVEYTDHNNEATSHEKSDANQARESLSSEEKSQHVEYTDHNNEATSHEKSDPNLARESLSSEEKSQHVEYTDHNNEATSHEKSDPNQARESLSSEEKSQHVEYTDHNNEATSHEKSDVSQVIDSSVVSESESSDSDSSEDPEVSNTFPSGETREESNPDEPSKEGSSKTEVQSDLRNTEDFVTWQRIIRLDAVRANAEWIPYSPSQAKVSRERACQAAEAVGLKDYDHLEPCRIFHASRLVAILEAYALHDPEIGYCQGMSDLLSPIIAVMTEDHEAFWCFVGFMRKARHNFRLDEIGIRRQLNIVSRIIKTKDSHLYRHLEKLQAEDCFFVYRMVVVLFRRELSFEQTLCLWEVMWADQAAIRAGIGKSAWSKIRQRAPPTEDLLLYAIAASVFQRRKQIIEKYSSMDEILRECNSMAGHLDVWRLLDDAHDLVVTLHDKIETSF